MQAAPPPYTLPPPLPHLNMGPHQGMPGSGPSSAGILGTPSLYQPPYTNGAGSMPTLASGMSETMSMQDDSVGTPHMSPSHHSLSSISAQKRAYRQRRKDPSCDACRERKVKCDATDASSCSECSSRSVKCQFTKETNRRMSSMKQVQDLERQLHQARQQIGQLKGMMNDNGAPHNSSVSSNLLVLPDSNPAKERAPAPRAMKNFFKVRRNIRNYGRGIFKPPQLYRMPPVQIMCQDDGPDIPPKHLADRLLAQYKMGLHPFAPLLHWPTFQGEVDNLYRKGSFKGGRKIWVAVFFAVLACGTLFNETIHRDEPAGFTYLEAGVQHINSMSDGVTIDHARATLLMSVYFSDRSLRSAAWIWLGAAVRTAQECGLHQDPGQGPPMQVEMRRRVWWSIYNWDRILSLELNQPPAVADADCDVDEPTPIDDESIGPNGFQPTSSRSAPHALLVLIPVVRIIHQLKKTLKARSVTTATLQIYDDHFNSIMDSYPDPFPIGSLAPLDPLLIHPALSLQIARFMLYRHNLSVTCRPQERQDAVRRCLQVAKDTAHYIYRTTPTARSQQPRLAIHPPDISNPDWRARTRLGCPPFVCTHLWRCTLVLVLCGEFGPALTCVGAMSAVGDMKRVNTACGRNLTFFVERVLQRMQSGGGLPDLQSDEEMLAYASGDLQGCQDRAWAWAGSETDSQPSTSASPPPAQEHIRGDADSGEYVAALLTEEEEKEWGGWESVEGMLRQLYHGHLSKPAPNVPLNPYHNYSPEAQRLPTPQQAHAPRSIHSPQVPQHNSTPRPYPPMNGHPLSALPPPVQARSPYLSNFGNTNTTSATSTSASTPSNPVSRISIKDII